MGINHSSESGAHHRTPVKGQKMDDGSSDLYLSPQRQNEYCQLSPPTSPVGKTSALTTVDRQKTPWVKKLEYNISTKVLGNGTFAQVHMRAQGERPAGGGQGDH